MAEIILTSAHTVEYEAALRAEERAPATIEKYSRDIRSFYVWLDGRPVTKELAIQWREHLLEQGYTPATVNAMVSAVNRFLQFLDFGSCRIKYLRVQRKVFRDQKRVLTRDEYRRLLETARAQGKDRLELLMETICSTGIRVSEVRSITVEAALRGRAEISLKGKIRTIILPMKLCRKLLKYARKNKTASGEIFLTKGGHSLSRRQIWREMKALCGKAGVEASKVFPHNLRHLFACVFYKACRDIAKLADILGHSSINTTRTYLMTSGEEHSRALEKLGLVT